MIDLVTVIGGAAAFCTTVCNVPQLQKVWATGETDDISMKMLVTLATGLVLWLAYGVMRGDAIIIVANVASLALVLGIFSFKVRGMMRRKGA